MATIEDVRAAAHRCRERANMKMVKAVLAVFGVLQVIALSEDQYDEAIRRFDEGDAKPRMPRSGYSEGGDRNTIHCICREGLDHIQNGTACWPGYVASNTGPVMFMGYPDIPEAPPEYVLVAFCPWCGRRPKP